MQARRTGRKNIGSAKQSRADEHLSFRDTADLGTPSPRGLYDPALEKDSCGVGFIADLKGRKSHKIIDDGLTILLNLEHRGAVGADPRMGDGAGILVQIPHKFFVKEAARIGFKLPKPGEYAVGYLFMPQDFDPFRPSSDTPTHLALYRRYAEIGGVVHTHSSWASAWAQAGRAIPCLGTTHADHFHGAVPVTRALAPSELDATYEADTGAVIVETLDGLGLTPLEMPAVLVRSHGPFTWGASVTEAVANAIALEAVAAMAQRTLALDAAAGPIGGALLERHFRRKHGSTAYYGQVDRAG